MNAEDRINLLLETVEYQEMIFYTDNSDPFMLSKFWYHLSAIIRDELVKADEIKKSYWKNK